MSALVTVTIDGADFQVEEGRNMLDVSLSLGFDLPYFCWHPGMGSVGACRQCAVMLYWTDRGGREHEEIAMACMTQAEQGTRIAIQHPEARAYRAKMIELLMVSHPHDCPVCDEGGECHLQDMTVMTGHVSRRYRFRKRTFRNQDLGPFVTHELNRCIACYRCVRFYRDYAGGSDFGVFSIRNHVYFGRQKDGTLQSEFSGNLVEVCPTGVFTDKTLAGHYTRKWDLQTAPSVCPHCGMGCSTFAAERYGEVRRVLARYNRAVNGHFLCDRGRFGYEFASGAARLRAPLVRRDGAVTRLRAGVAPDTALGEAPDVALDPHLGAAGGGPPQQAAALEDRVLAGEIRAAVVRAADALRVGAVVGIGSPRASLEANFALRTLVGPDNFYLGLSERERDLADLALALLRGGPSPAATRTDVGNADALVVLGVDLTNTAPILDLNLRTWLRLRPTTEEDRLHIARWNDAAIGRLKEFEPSALWLAHTHATKLEAVAAGAVRGVPEELALFVRALTAALDPGAPPVRDLAGHLRDDIEEWSAALRRASRPVVISGTSCGSGALLRAAADLAWRLPRGERQGAPLFLTQAEANTLGLVMMGGGRLADALAAGAVGRATAAVVLENDLFRRASAAEVEGFFSGCSRAVVLDHLASETTTAADVVLPAANWAESSGTFVSAEGRAQRFFQVLVPEEGIRESWRWLRDIVGALGGDEQAGWATLQDVIESLAAELPELAPIRDAAPPADFRSEGLRVNRKPPRYSGRTAMTAHLSVREPRPPDDPDSPLSFSPEGYDGANLPASLVPRYWAPGWNSGNSLQRFQEEVNGPLRGGDLGARLIEPGAEVARAAAAAGATPGDDGAASAPGLEGGEWLVVPLHHIFGSEELSSRAPAVATRVPPPYVGVGEDDAAQFVTDDGGYASLVWGGYRIHLPVQLVPGLPRGVAGLPVGLPGLAGVEPPFRARLVPERGRDA